jgi:hypothetical protein
MRQRLTTTGTLGLGTALLVLSCTPNRPNDLNKLGTVTLSINGQAFELWIADDDQERQRGLMFVTTEQMAPLPDGIKRGMLFVFEYEQPLSFWMKNTIIPLDIAYLDSAGKVVATHTMAPLDTRPGQYTSRSPARFAIEVNADVLDEIDVDVGDTIEIPASVR